jgi:hypothetical protein
MKRMTTIAKELRANGRMFSQTSLMKELASLEPAFQQGNVVFYDDSVTGDLMNRFKVRKVPLVAVPEYHDHRDGNWDDFMEVKQMPDPQLVRIERMLSEICSQLGVPVAV